GLFARGGIDPFAQFLAGLEMRHLLARHHHLLARLGIAADTWRPRRQRKAAEATNLDALTRGQRLSHGLEHGFDRNVRIANRKLRVAAGEYRNQLRLGHAINRRRGPDPAWPSAARPGWWYRTKRWPRTCAGWWWRSRH